jgi:hypothetical protein
MIADHISMVPSVQQPPSTHAANPTHPTNKNASTKKNDHIKNPNTTISKFFIMPTIAPTIRQPISNHQYHAMQYPLMHILLGMNAMSRQCPKMHILFPFVLVDVGFVLRFVFQKTRLGKKHPISNRHKNLSIPFQQVCFVGCSHYLLLLPSSDL